MEPENKSSEKNSVEKKDEKKSGDLLAELKTATENLIYISETDAPFEAFVWKTESQVAEARAEDVLKFAGQKSDAKVVEKSLDEFFQHPTEMQDWFGDEEKTQVEKFIKLKNLLSTKLENTKVFKIGEIQIDVYIVGIDNQGNLAGVKTKAVET